MLRVLSFFITIAMMTSFPASSQEEPQATGADFDWTIFRVSDFVGAGYVDHRGWDNLLQGSVFSAQDRERLTADGRGGPNSKPPTGTRIPSSGGRSSADLTLIPYDFLTPDYNQVLERYLVMMQEIEISTLTRDEQLAYWLNLHNAAAFHVILNSERRGDADDYRLRSRNRPAVFDEDDLIVEGIALSINDIAENILPLWRDPMVMYGLFFGARGGPNVLPRAFTGRNVHDLLQASARAFINTDRAIEDIDDDTLELSELYRLYLPFFRNDEQFIIEHLREFSSPYRQRQLASVTEIEYTDMDWDLNDMSREARSNDWSELLAPKMGTFGNSGRTFADGPMCSGPGC